MMIPSGSPAATWPKLSLASSTLKKRSARLHKRRLPGTHSTSSQITTTSATMALSMTPVLPRSISNTMALHSHVPVSSAAKLSRFSRRRKPKPISGMTMLAPM